MPCKLHERYEPDTIPVQDMADGQLAVIVHQLISDCVGWVVQRHGDNIIRVGGRRNQFWPVNNKSETFRVRVLKPGELIQVTQ